jgi:Sulfatase-modifying factor enzyme 1
MAELVGLPYRRPRRSSNGPGGSVGDIDMLRDKLLSRLAGLKQGRAENAAPFEASRVIGPGPEQATKIGNVLDATAGTKFPAWAPPVKSSDGFVFTCPRVALRPTTLGCFDVLGNVQEWCTDVYNRDYYKHSPVSGRPLRRASRKTASFRPNWAV